VVEPEPEAVVVEEEDTTTVDWNQVIDEEETVTLEPVIEEEATTQP